MGSLSPGVAAPPLVYPCHGWRCTQQQHWPPRPERQTSLLSRSIDAREQSTVRPEPTPNIAGVQAAIRLPGSRHEALDVLLHHLTALVVTLPHEVGVDLLRQHGRVMT